MQLKSHFAFPVCSAEADAKLWKSRLQLLGKGKRREVLFKSGCETDESVVLPGNGCHAVIQKVTSACANTQDPLNVGRRDAPRSYQNLIDIALVVRGTFAVEQVREAPLSGERRVGKLVS